MGTGSDVDVRGVPVFVVVGGDVDSVGGDSVSGEDEDDEDVAGGILLLLLLGLETGFTAEGGNKREEAERSSG